MLFNCDHDGNVTVYVDTHTIPYWISFGLEKRFVKILNKGKHDHYWWSRQYRLISPLDGGTMTERKASVV